MTILRFIASVWLYVILLPAVYLLTPILSLFTCPDFEVRKGSRGRKIKSDKFSSPGDKAQLVFTFNPFDGYRSK